METGCNDKVSLSGVQLCILLGVGGVKTKHGPPHFWSGPIDCTYMYMDQVHGL